MNKLRELCEKWDRTARVFDVTRGDSAVEEAYRGCAAELRAILPDVERLIEARIAELEAER